MFVTEHLNRSTNSGRAVISIEVLPPLRGGKSQSLFSSIDPIIEFKPAFINVTHHQREFRMHSGPGGQPVLKQTRKRPGTVGICAAISAHYKIDTVAHIIAAGHTEDEIENILIELDYLGIDNVLALRGDRVKNDLLGEHSAPHANSLVKQIVKMNKGVYQGQTDHNAKGTNFEIGVAGYPEKHYEAPNLEEDVARLVEKVDAGASYVVTQMFFDNEKYFRFVEMARKAGITVPIIPGLKPLSQSRHLQSIPGFFHIDIPSALSSELKQAKDEAAVREIGIAWCIQQVKGLIAAGAPCVHFYTIGKGKLVQRVLKQVF